MHIGLDVRKYFDFGIGTYIQNLMLQFDNDNSLRYTVIAEPGSIETIRHRHRAEVIGNSSGKYSLGELFSVSRQINNAKVDLFHSPHYTQPYNLKCKSVVTVHDLIHLRFPEYFSLAQRTYARLMIRHACTASDLVIVDSDFTKSELLDQFSIKPEKIRTVHLGVGGKFFAEKDDRSVQQFRAKHNITKPYILYTGNAKPHKNIGVLIRAFAQMRNAKEYVLVFSGEGTANVPELIRLAEETGCRNAIIDVGRLPEDDLVNAYQDARCVVLPSLYEGFGLPVVEAMAARTPVIGARAASIPEVMGDGGLLFDPSSPDDLTDKLQRVLDDDTLRASLVAKGTERVKQFSWEVCAAQTLRLYREVLS